MPESGLIQEKTFNRIWSIAQTARTWSAEMAMQLSIMFTAAYAMSPTGIDIPNWITLLAAGIGPNILSGLLEKWAGRDVNEAEVVQELMETLAQLDFDAVLTRKEARKELKLALGLQKKMLRSLLKQSEKNIAGALIQQLETQQLLADETRQEVLGELVALAAEHEELIAGQDTLLVGQAKIYAAILLLQERLNGDARRIPLERPDPVEKFTDREDELKRLLADIKPGQVAWVCGPGGMGKTALAAKAVWSLAPGLKAPDAFPDGIVTHNFYNQPQMAQALEYLFNSFGDRA